MGVEANARRVETMLRVDVEGSQLLYVRVGLFGAATHPSSGAGGNPRRITTHIDQPLRDEGFGQPVALSTLH